MAVDVSSDLVSWRQAYTGYLNYRNTLTFDDFEAGDGPRFYRIVADDWWTAGSFQVNDATGSFSISNAVITVQPGGHSILRGPFGSWQLPSRFLPSDPMYTLVVAAPGYASASASFSRTSFAFRTFTLNRLP